ncbi:hypothetical protein [Burkholderia cenocepacia]|uniref:hypothetical protein n=1 Tax=Burkholderia cenocepacia TaxID=95486 RepID=UPI0020130750|nr:hypothetical protein [Burkholderia cenocepacia]
MLSANRKTRTTCDAEPRRETHNRLSSSFTRLRVQITGSVTVDDISRRRTRPRFAPIVDAITLSGTTRIITGKPPAKHFDDPPPASRVSYLRVVKRARALRINP